MLTLPDRASIEAALHQPLDPSLHALLVETWRRAEAPGLLDLTHILAIQPGDSEESMIDAIGFSPLVNPLDGARFGTAAFLPYWSFLRDVGGWYELIHTVGDSGFAFILLIEKAAGGLDELFEMCRCYSKDAG